MLPGPTVVAPTEIEEELAELGLREYETTFNDQPITIDQSTGSVLTGDKSPLTFRTIDEAEAFLYRVAGEEESMKLLQIRGLLAIKDQQLFKQGVDDDGNYFTSFDKYLKDLSGRMTALSGDKTRSLKSWMTRVRVFQHQLGYTDEWLLRLGYHGEMLLQVAARDSKWELALEDEELESGGRRLGLAPFKRTVDDVATKVSDPTLEWTTKDTRFLVDSILKKDTHAVKRELEAVWVGKDIEVKSITWWVDDVAYRLQNASPFRLSLDEFRLLAGGDMVQGLGDNWKESPRA